MTNFLNEIGERFGGPPPFAAAGPLSPDRLVRLLAALAVLLFVGRTMLPPGLRRSVWAGRAKWSAVAAFSAAVLLALAMTLRWVAGGSP